MIRFQIDDGHEDGRGYEVRVYPTRRSYLAACRRRRPAEEHRSSHASCFHERTINFGPDGEHEAPILGAIYVHQQMLDAEITTHEATHAALNLYRRRHRGVVSLGRNCSEADGRREEELALSIGRLSQEIADRLWEHRVWTRRRKAA